MTEINNRIEEVKKILRARYDENRLCEDFLNSVARQICKLFPQPLDDKELGWAIDGVVKGRLTSVETLAWYHKYDWSQKDKMIQEHLDYIHKDLLALLQPKIEDRVQENNELWLGTLREAGLNVGHPSDVLPEIQSKIEEARKQMCQDCTYKWEHHERVLANPTPCRITSKKGKP